MPERDRSLATAAGIVVVAIFAFAIGLWGGAGNRDHANPNDHGAPKPYSGSLTADTFWHEHAGSSESYQSICDSPIDGGQADLCQQWRAANAAQEAASDADWSVVLSVIGVLGLLFTIYLSNKATIAATDATEAAVRSAVAAEKAYAAERRPWLRLKLREILQVQVDENGGVSVAASFQVRCLNDNPADEVMVSFKGFKIVGMPISRSEVAELAKEFERSTVYNDFLASVVLPGSRVRADRITNAIWHPRDRHARHSTFRIAVVAVATYKAVGSDTVHHTAETYIIRRKVGESDETRGFFVEGEKRLYLSHSIEAGHSNVGSHAT